MKNILVIDYEESRRDFFRHITGDEFKLFLAKNAGQGMGGFTKLRPPIVILHCESDGLQLAADIRNLEGGKNCAIVVLGCEKTADASIITLPWPLEVDKLKEALRNIPESAPDTPKTEKSPAAEKAVDYSAHMPEMLRSFPELKADDVEYIGAETLFSIMHLFEKLDELDYYQVLGVPGDENPALIRKRYFSLARGYHPDHFASLTPGAFRLAAGQVFKRMTEAYQVLMSAEKRAEYDRQLEREGRSPDSLRFSSGEREQKGPKVRDREIESPQARKFYNLAQSAMRDGDYAAARMNLKLAAQMAGEHPLIKKSLEEVELLLQK